MIILTQEMGTKVTVLKKLPLLVNIFYILMNKGTLDKQQFPYLAFLDEYGTTVFSRLQMQPVLDEVRRVLKLTSNQEELFVLRAIEELAIECQQTVDGHLRFVGY